jgi:hypothetical protein
MSTLDIQREYLAKAKDFTSSRGADAISTRVLGLRERAPALGRYRQAG